MNENQRLYRGEEINIFHYMFGPHCYKNTAGSLGLEHCAIYNNIFTSFTLALTGSTSWHPVYLQCRKAQYNNQYLHHAYPFQRVWLLHFNNCYFSLRVIESHASPIKIINP